MTVGFIGLGRMGEPMASRLARGGVDLMAWSRRPEPVRRVAAAGATAAATAREVVEACDVVLLMLANADAVDEVLQRDETGFGVPVAGRLVVSFGTVSPDSSAVLEGALRRAGARFVEAPVSGSRVPAETGRLVAMLAGDAAGIREIEPIVRLLASSSVECGAVPRALETKLAVNVFLIAMVAGLAEAMAFAEARGVDAEAMRAVLDAGPMASAVSTVKLAKLAEGDLSAQAAVDDVLYNNRLILDAAPSRDRLPLLSATERLFARASELGHGSLDMIAVIEALRTPGRG